MDFFLFKGDFFNMRYLIKAFFVFSVFLYLFPITVFSQDEPRRAARYAVRVTPGAAASDTSFAVGSTSTVVSNTYRSYEFISYGVIVTSSGTVDIVVSLQYQWTNEHGDLSAFVTIETKTITTTGLTSFIPSNALPNHPCKWRLSITGQGSNHSSTACRVYFAGDNPNE